MTEIADILLNTQKSRTKFLGIALAVLIPLLVYGAGIIVLPITILTNYQSKNCDSVLSLHKMYTSVYPGFIQDKTLSSPVNECAAYRLAALNEEKGNWRDAYDSYQVYSTTYPNGLYTAEAHEHSAIVLMDLAKEQAEQQKYDEALANLDQIVSSYSDTSVSAEAWTLFPSIYTSWGTDLRESTDFERAEQVFNEFKTWSQSNQKAEPETVAQSELAQTYLAWGLALQSQKQFENALAKFNLAVSVDTLSQFDSAAQVKAGQRRVYIEWGNGLLEQGEFSAAIEKLELAVSRSDGNNEDGVKDALANGHIQWAHNLSADEDFQGALEQLEIARQAAISDAMKKSVDTSFRDTYLAFSNSSGLQARRAMKEALITICKRHKEPGLPIFGLNSELIRVGIYGVDAQLPENLAARTPGELHYVACVEAGNHTVESRSQKVIVQRTSWGYYYKIVKQYRAELLWNISLLKTDTIKSITKKTFTGGTPPPFPEGNMSGDYLYGPPPIMAELAEWLLSIIK